MDNAYNENRFGSIPEYIEWCRRQGLGFKPYFRGFEPFQELWDLGYLIPDQTIIRLYFDTTARTDQCYFVTGENELEGMKLQAHSGIEGKHNPRELLCGGDVKHWEITAYDLHPAPRKDS